MFYEEETAEHQLNQPSLVKFLVRATPILERELEAANRSRAFDGYTLSEEEKENEGKT